MEKEANKPAFLQDVENFAKTFDKAIKEDTPKDVSRALIVVGVESITQRDEEGNILLDEDGDPKKSVAVSRAMVGNGGCIIKGVLSLVDSDEEEIAPLVKIVRKYLMKQQLIPILSKICSEAFDMPVGVNLEFVGKNTEEEKAAETEATVESEGQISAE